MLVWLTEGITAHTKFPRDVYDQDNNAGWLVSSGTEYSLANLLQQKRHNFETTTNGGEWANLVGVIRRMFIIDARSRITAQQLATALNSQQHQI
jgi:hypothetical protein